MDQKRFLAFIVLSMTILIGWNAFILPRLVPPKPKPPAEQVVGKEEDPALADDKRAPAKDVAAGPAEQDEADKPQAEAVAADENQPADTQPPDKQPDDQPQPVARAQELPKFPDRTVQLGSKDFQSGYRQLVTLTSRGAAVKEIELNDARYLTLDKPHRPLKVIGESDLGPATLELAVPQLAADISQVNWKLDDPDPNEETHSSAVFRMRLDDLEVIKRYELAKADVADARRGEAQAYALKVDLTFKNLGKAARTINYVLQGPTGLPLENVENTQKYRDVVAGFQKDADSIDNQLMAAKTIAEGNGQEWKNPIKYIGVDVQFFAALLLPSADQLQSPYTNSLKQELVGPNLKEKSDVSVQLTSVDLTLEKASAANDADQATHSYTLFAGPKRDDVLPVGTEKVIDFGSIFGVLPGALAWISRSLLAVLMFFHHVTGSWGLAVICLTICVRGAMFPISIKQSRSAAKMQLIQPEIAALKQKFGNDKEKFARAQMELFRKHNHNPFTGCLPVFLQLPIFMGLYQALNHAVDLRLAKFLWVDNLAAPDALFRMPMNIPFLGQDFNLLPIITVALFVAQQKMFMPPPANEEQAMQQKVMNFMMIFMGVMFYKVPAGLCVYFIASSLWGMGERKLLPKPKPGAVSLPTSDDTTTGRRKRPGSDDQGTADKPSGDGGGGLWGMLLKAAEKEPAARRSGDKRR